MDFVEKNLKGNEPARCVDGRPDPKSPQGPQMLGGSLHPLVINAIFSNKNFDIEEISGGLKKLKNAGFAVGVHWGSHKHEDKSDCGFADRLIDILKTVINNKTEILNRLKTIYKTNNIDSASLLSSYQYIMNYDIAKINLIGKELIDFAIENHAPFENLQGDHGEQAAFINLKPNTTLDTQKLNSQNKQAFNLDLWSAIKQGSTLIGLTEATKNVNTKILRDLFLILYISTEMVLVEQKGKPALPVILHK